MPPVKQIQIQIGPFSQQHHIVQLLMLLIADLLDIKALADADQVPDPVQMGDHLMDRRINPPFIGSNIDDFMKGGGTLTGMEGLVKEFDSKIVGICVLCEADFDKDKLVEDYLSLVKISKIDTNKRIILSEPGNFLNRTDFSRF